MEWAVLHAFGQPGGPDTSAATHFFQAYHDLRLAAYDSAYLPRPTNVLERLAWLRFDEQVIPLGVIAVDCAHLDTLSLRDGLLHLDPTDSTLHDVPGRPRSPWLTRRTVVAAPLVRGKLRAGQPHTFELTPDLLATHLTTWTPPPPGPAQRIPIPGDPIDPNAAVLSAVEYVKVDFADGQSPVALEPGKQATVTYTTPGLKVLRFYIHLRDGSDVQTSGALMVDEIGARTASVPVEPCRVVQFQSTMPFAGSTTGGDAYYFYRDGAPCNGTPQPLRKPVIMVDGFDPTNKRNGTEVFNKYLEYNGDNLGSNLRALGYDVIILDLSGSRTHAPNDGADYLERNAMVLMELINRVNAELLASGSSEKLVVIGPSMAGLISRYALAYMERNPTAPYTDPATGQRRTPPVFPGGGPSHHTRLYVSFDSPHLGANILIGAQLLAEFYARMGEYAAEQGRQKLASVAAQQMLMDHYHYHVRAGATGISPAPARAPFKQHLYQNGLPGSGGWPMQLRKVSMVNGSLTGTGMHSACGDAFSQKTTLFRRWGRLLAFFYPNFITLTKADVNFTPGYGNGCEVFMGTYPPRGSNGYQRQEEHRWSQAAPNSCSLDNAPGGYYDTQRQLHSAPDGLTWFGQQLMYLRPNWTRNTYEHTFIPPSARWLTAPRRAPRAFRPTSATTSATARSHSAIWYARAARRSTPTTGRAASTKITSI